MTQFVNGFGEFWRFLGVGGSDRANRHSGSAGLLRLPLFGGYLAGG